ncbi:MAG: acyl-CoA dehydrogenase [Pseudomonadota bacterium]
MALVLNEEQRMLKDSAKQFFSEKMPINQLRELRDTSDADGFSRDAWNEMVELGWTGIPFPESFGGLGFGYQGLGVVAEEGGRTLAVSPLFSTIWLSGSAIMLGGSDEQKEAHLPALAAGEKVMALALDEGPHHAPYNISTTAAESGGSYTLNGEKKFVIDGHVADQLVVVARVSGQAGDRNGLALFLVDGNTDGVTRDRLNMVDSRNLAHITLNNVTVGADALLGVAGEGAEVLDRVLDIGRIGLAAEMLGSAQEAFDRTVQYLKERRQFGVLIGSFQALKHRAAKMFCEIELSKSVLMDALSMLDDDSDATSVAQAASLAKAQIGETLRLTSREAIQMHGGIGMTDEFDIGFFMKRAAVVESLLGDVAFHRDRYASLEGY